MLFLTINDLYVTIAQYVHNNNYPVHIVTKYVVDTS